MLRPRELNFVASFSLSLSAFESIYEISLLFGLHLQLVCQMTKYKYLHLEQKRARCHLKLEIQYVPFKQVTKGIVSAIVQVLWGCCVVFCVGKGQDVVWHCNWQCQLKLKQLKFQRERSGVEKLMKEPNKALAFWISCRSLMADAEA